MANSEQSFADRLDRGNSLHAVIAGFSPAFDASDPALLPAAFQTYLGSLETANQAVTDTAADFTDATTNRSELADGLKATALRAKDYVTSNVNWKKWHTAVGRAADKVRGYALPKKPATPPKPVRKGARSQQGYGDLAKLFNALIAALKKVTGYDEAVFAGLAIDDLEAQRAAYVTAMGTVTEKEADYNDAVSDRAELYNDKDTGLNAKMKAIKKATRSQYGGTSAEYAAASAIKV